jgi:hypothetical protein
LQEHLNEKERMPKNVKQRMETFFEQSDNESGEEGFESIEREGIETGDF